MLRDNVEIMPRFFFLLLVTALLTACGGDTSAPDTPVSTEATAPAAAPGETLISPPPPVCVYLTEATVLSYFEAKVQLPMPGRRSAAEFASCQYDLEAPGWSAALIIEMPEQGPKQQAIIDEVAGAKEPYRVAFSQAVGRFQNEGRILSVSGSKHFRVKFSALPKAGFAAPFSEEERRGLLEKIAAGVLAI